MKGVTLCTVHRREQHISACYGVRYNLVLGSLSQTDSVLVSVSLTLNLTPARLVGKRVEKVIQ